MSLAGGKKIVKQSFFETVLSNLFFLFFLEVCGPLGEN